MRERGGGETGKKQKERKTKAISLLPCGFKRLNQTEKANSFNPLSQLATPIEYFR